MDGTTLLYDSEALHTEKKFNLQNVNETVTFGPVHLNNTSIEKAIFFWTKVIGMRLRSQSAVVAEFGTKNTTLVVVHKAATKKYIEGYSGLYHFAIHLPNNQEFAKTIYRLQKNNYPFSPIDHTMTQSLYLNDYDNVMIELALETPERFKRVIKERGLFIEDVEGTIRSISAPLDTEKILKNLGDKDLNKIISEKAKIGHIHFYAHDVALSNTFYKNIGFSQFNFIPEFKYADLGAGGLFQHRIAMNSWHGCKKPLAPAEYAGLRYYQIILKSNEYLQRVIKSIDNIEDTEGIYWTTDPTGVKIKLSIS